MKRPSTTAKLIALSLVFAIFATVFSLGVYFGVNKTTVDSNFSSSTDSVTADADSELLKGSPTSSTGPTASVDNVEIGYSSDAGNVLVRLTSSTAPSGAVAIDSEDDLHGFVSNSSKSYGYLTSDISIDGSSSYQGATSNSLGDWQILDGNGYTITFTGNGNKDTGYSILSGMTNNPIDGITNNAVVQGFLMPKNNGTIKNLKVVLKKNYNLHTNSNSLNMVAGLLVGWNAGTIENCSAMFSIDSHLYTHCSGRSTNTTTNGAYVGGIAGVNTGTIEYCTTTNYARNWEAAAYYQVVMGGIAGVNNGGRIAYCVYRGSGEMYANGDTGTGGGTGSAIGGIVGISGQSGSTFTVSSNHMGGPSVTISKGTLTMCTSTYTGTFKIGGGSKYVGLIAGYFDTANNATVVGLTAYSHSSSLGQVGASKGSGTYTINDITWTSGQGNTSNKFYGGRLYFADACDYNVYYDYFSQSDKMYVEFDNPAAISSITPAIWNSVKSMTYNSDDKTLSKSASEFNRLFFEGYYIGAQDISYQGYESAYAYGSAAATVSQGSDISTSGTQITQNTMFPLTGETDYYLLDDVYIDLHTQYSGSTTGNFRGLVNGNGHNIYFYTSSPVDVHPSVTETYYFGILSNEIGGDNNDPGECGFKNMGVVFTPNCSFSAVTTGGNSKAGIITGLQKLQYSSKVDNVKIDIQKGATVTIGNNNNNQNSFVGIAIGQLTGGPTGRIARVWINLEGSFIIAKGTDRAAYAGALWGWGLNSNLNINGGIGGYYILSGTGTYKVNSSCDTWTTLGLFGGASDGGYGLNNGSEYALGIIFWDWAWRVNQSNGGHVNMQAGRHDPQNGGFHERKWFDSANMYFINADPSYGATNAFTKSGTTYTVTWVNGGSNGTTKSLDSVYGTYSIYQALGSESRILTAGIAGSQTKYNAEKYIDTNIAFEGLETGYSTVTSVARYQSVGYDLQDTTLKLKVDLVNKNITPMGYQYDGSTKGTVSSDYVLVPSGYANAPDNKKAKVVEVAGLGNPYSASGGGIDVGTHNVDFSLSSTQATNFKVNTSRANVVVYPAPNPDIPANTISRNYEAGSNTHTYTYLGSSRKFYYSQKSPSNIYAEYDGSDTLGDDVPVWMPTSAFTSTTVPAYYKDGAVVASTTHYVLSNHTFGTEGGTAVVFNGYLRVDIDGGQIVLQDITNAAFTMIVTDNTGTSHTIAHNGTIEFAYDGSVHSITDVAMTLGSTPIELSPLDDNSLRSVTASGVTLSFEPMEDIYQGVFVFSYFVIPRTVSVTGVQAVYNTDSQFELDTTKSALVNEGTADTSGFAIATISNVLAGDSLGTQSVTFADGNAGSSKAVTIATSQRTINNTTYNMLGVEGADAGNYCVASASLGAVGTIHKRAMQGLTSASPIFYKRYAQASIAGQTLDLEEVGTPIIAGGTFDTVYNRDEANFDAQDYLYTDSAMNAPVARANLSYSTDGSSYSAVAAAKAIGYYRVDISNKEDPNYTYLSSGDGNLSIYFRIVPYNVLVTAETTVTYGDQNVDSTKTQYTYQAYGQPLDGITWASQPQVDLSSYSPTIDAGTSSHQDIAAGFYSQDGIYYVPDSVGRHSLNIEKATVIVRANDNTTSRGAVESGKLTQTFSYISGFRNGDTDSVVTINQSLRYIYEGITDSTQEGVKPNVIFIADRDNNSIRATTIKELSATNYVFVQDTVGGTLTIKLEVTSTVTEVFANTFKYTGADRLEELKEDRHYTLSSNNITATVALKVSGKYNSDNVLDTTVSEFKGVGTYVIEFVIEEGTQDAETYYITPMTWTINKALATITANPHTAPYGEVPTTNSGYVITGLLGDDVGKESTLLGEIAYSYTYQAGGGRTGTINPDTQAVNAYTLTPIPPIHENYEFTAVAGTLEIVKRVITAEWFIDADLEVGSEYTDTSFTYSGSQYTVYPKITNAYNNEAIYIEAVSGYYGVNALEYTAKLGISSATNATVAGNYEVNSSSDFKWKINRQPVEILAADIENAGKIVYLGAADTKFKTSDFKIVDAKLAYAKITGITEVVYLNAGLYEVELTLTANQNYEFSGGTTTTITFENAKVWQRDLGITDASILQSNEKIYDDGKNVTFGIADFTPPLHTTIAENGVVANGEYINAGTSYTISVTLVADSLVVDGETIHNYCLGEEGIYERTYTGVPVTVSPKPITYDASDITMSATANNVWVEGGVVLSDSDFNSPLYTTLTSATSRYGKTGDYLHTVTLTIADTNYIFEGNQNTLVLSNVAITIKRASLNYNKDNIIQSSIVRYIGPGAEVSFGKNDFTAPLYTDIAATRKVDGVSYVNAGEYTYFVTLKAKENYCFDGVQDKLTKEIEDVVVTISKKLLDYTNADISQTKVEYSGGKIDFVALQAAQNIFTAQNVSSIVVEEVVGEDYIEVGKHTVKLTLTADSNHVFAGEAETLVLQLFEAEISVVQVYLAVADGYDILTKVYDGTDMYTGPITAGTHYTVTASDNRVDFVYVTADSALFSNINAGDTEVIVTFVLTDSNSYEFADGKNTIALDARINPVELIANVSGIDREYDGTTLVGLTGSLYGNIVDKGGTPEDVSLGLGQGVVEAPDAREAAYTVTINTDTVDSVWLEGQDRGNYVLTINPITVHIRAKEISSVDWTFDTSYEYGRANKVAATFKDVNNMSSDAVRMVYNNDESVAFVDAGTYVVKAVSTDTNYNITAPSVSLTIAERKVDYDESSITTRPSYVYTGSDVVLSSEGFTKIDNVVITVSEIEGQDYCQVGTPSVMLTLTLDKNHIFRDNNGKVRDIQSYITITQATPTLLVQPTVSGIRYRDSISTAIIGDDAEVYLNETISDISGSFAWANNTEYADDVGNLWFDAIFTPQDTRNFTSATFSISVTVGKAIPTILENPTASEINYGKTIEASVLNGGSASVEGYFCWVDPTEKPDQKGDFPYSAKFVPTSTRYYEEVVLAEKITVVVIAPLANIFLDLSSITYGGVLDDITFENCIASYDDIANLGGSFAWSDGTIMPTVGESSTKEYEIIWTPDEGDSERYAITSYMTKVTVNPKELTVTGTDVEKIKTYDGTNRATINAYGTAEGKLDIDNSTILVATAQFGSTDVGENLQFTITYRLDGSAAQNYTIKDSEIVTYDAQIVPLEAVIFWQSTLSYVYDASIKTVTATVSNAVAEDAAKFNIIYTDNTKTDAGEYTAVITDLGNPNYSLPEEGRSTAWTIEQKAIYLEWSNSMLTYNAGEQSVGVAISSGVIGDDEVVVYVEGNTGKNVGQYTAAAIGLSNGNYKIAEGMSWKYEIAPLKVTVSGYIVEDTKTYDGNRLAAVDATNILTNIDALDDVTVSVSASYDGYNVNSKVITVKFSLSGEDVSNYAKPDDEQISGTITPRVAELAWNTASLVYNGYEQSVTAQVTNVLSTEDGLDTVYVLTYLNNKAKDVNTYTATAATLSSLNYTLTGCANIEHQYSIVKADLADNTANVSIIYTGKEVGLQLNVAGFFGTDSLSDATKQFGTSQDNLSDAEIKIKDASTIEVFYKLTFANYNTIEGKRTITISKATIRLVETGKQLVKVYDGTFDVGTAITSEYYTIVTDGAQPELDIVSAAYNRPSVKDATNVNVSFALVDTTNFRFAGDTSTYDLSLAGKITPAIVGLEKLNNAATITKVYDGTKSVQASVIAGIQQGVHYDVVYTPASVTTPVNIKSAEFSSSQVAFANDVIVTFELEDPDNFQFASPNGVVADRINISGTIEKSIIKVVAVADYPTISKVYDGTRTYKGSLDGIYEIYSTNSGAVPSNKYYEGTFASKDASDDNPLTVVFGITDINNFAFEEDGNIVIFDNASITKRDATVKVESLAIVYGNLPSYQYTVDNVVDNDAAIADVQFGTDYDIATNRNVGVYDIWLSDYVANSNYNITIEVGTQSNPAKLEVTKAHITVTAGNSTISFGDEKPNDFTVEIKGLVAGDLEADLGLVSYDCTYDAASLDHSTVGQYPITPYGLDDTNYEIEYINGWLYVTQTIIKVVAKDWEIVYGDAPANDGVEYYLNGIKTEIDDIQGELAYEYNYVRYGVVGNYVITPVVKGIASGNYSFEAVSGILKVKEREIEVTAANITQVYGNELVNLSSNKYYSISSGSLVNNDKLIGTMSVDEFSGIETPDCGVYTIKRGTLGNNNTNYDITFVEGSTYTIEARKLVITLKDQYLVDESSVLDQTAYKVSSGTIINNDDLKLELRKDIAEGATEGSVVAVYDNDNYAITFRSGYLRYGKETSQIIYNNSLLSSITINIPYDGQEHVLDMSCTNGMPVIISYQGYMIPNSFTEVDTYELVVTAEGTNTHLAPTPVSFTLRIYYENLTNDVGIDATVSSANGFEKSDKFVVTELDKANTDLTSHVQEGQVVVEQYAITLKNSANNNIAIEDAKLVLDIDNDQLIDNGKVTLLICENGEYRIVTAEVMEVPPTSAKPDGEKKVIIDINEGIEQVAFIKDASAASTLYIGLGGLIAAAAVGAIIALIVVFTINNRNKKARRR